MRYFTIKRNLKEVNHYIGLCFFVFLLQKYSQTDILDKGSHVLKEMITPILSYLILVKLSVTIYNILYNICYKYRPRRGIESGCRGFIRLSLFSVFLLLYLDIYDNSLPAYLSFRPSTYTFIHFSIFCHQPINHWQHKNIFTKVPQLLFILLFIFLFNVNYNIEYKAKLFCNNASCYMVFPSK